MQPRNIDVFQVHTIQLNAALIGIIESFDQLDDGWLPFPRWAHQRKSFTPVNW